MSKVKKSSLYTACRYKKKLLNVDLVIFPCNMCITSEVVRLKKTFWRNLFRQNTPEEIALKKREKSIAG